MHSASHTWTVARQIAFFPSVSGGKIHAAHKISHTAVCGVAADLQPVAFYHTSEGQQSDKVHRMVCKKCLRLSTAPGYSGSGYEQ